MASFLAVLKLDWPTCYVVADLISFWLLFLFTGLIVRMRNVRALSWMLRLFCSVKSWHLCAWKAFIDTCLEAEASGVMMFMPP